MRERRDAARRARQSDQSGHRSGRSDGFHADPAKPDATLVPPGNYPEAGRLPSPRRHIRMKSDGRDAKIVNQKNKNSADIMTWREYEALRNEMRREFRTQDDELRGNNNQKKKTLSFRMKHAVLVVVLDVLTVVVALLNSELAVSLHNNKTMVWVKLASSEFDGYALRWWDGVTRARQEDNELPVLTWREMKAIMQARFVPANYLRTIYDKLTILRQGVKTVDVYFMEMEMLMQRGRVCDNAAFSTWLEV
ncbi:hypothetical protein QYE76_053243 [Lolium multiflorum]|uniref:Retrotransposon gag domain-containing protein n=1 Tax=Lolium multiflorum TaxID=4521 RepID=A0AAD8SWI9_LOLMU|nr:hypothetical protein QYE76_053243 [Lolium multiflorum]